MRWLPLPVLAVLMVVQSLDAGQVKTVQAMLSATSARQIAPDFTLKDGSGKTVRLSDYRGAVVLLDFWATKCGGCVEEIPMFIQVVDAYRAKGLRAIGVSEDIIYENLPGGSAQAWGQVKPFVRDHKIRYPVVVDDADVHRTYNITALPLTYLVDVRGRVAATYSGVIDRANLEDNIARLLSEAR